MYTLITAANSSEAYKLKNIIDSTHILLGDYMDLPDLLVQTGKVLKLPNPQNIAYTHQMLSLCLDKGIVTVYPLREPEKELLLNSMQLFNEYNISIVIADEI